MDKIIVRFKNCKDNTACDLEIPLDITAQDLVEALNTAFHLGIDTQDPAKAFLQAESPVALLRGEYPLRSFGLRRGSSIYFVGR